MPDRHRLLAILRAELTFLEQGGYRHSPRYPWRPNFVFEDSPTCIHFQTKRDKEERHACADCPLLDFVPQDRRQMNFPCRHIQLTERGETITSFYEWGTEEELETALGAWLRQTIRDLENGEKARSQKAGNTQK